MTPSSYFKNAKFWADIVELYTTHKVDYRLITYTLPHLGYSNLAQGMVQGFMDNYTVTYDYERYYNLCKPLKCVYYDQSSRSFTDVIVTLIGLVGGMYTLLVASKFLTQQKKIFCFCS